MKSITIVALVGIMFPTYAQWWQSCYYGLTPINDYFSCESYDDWVLVFEDEFNGTSLDTSIWRNDYPWGRSLYCADEATYYTDGDNMDISNGELTLTADEETIFGLILDGESADYDLVCDGEYEGENGRWFDYTSGMIFSKQKFLHGKFEIRCQIPPIELLWPAFWLYGECGQEIDVFEFMSDDPDPEVASEEPSYSYHRKIDCINDPDCKRELTMYRNWQIRMYEK
ncbi:MAG TPA: family 16 glycosylhydrolase [Bacteroidales bacterium]|nr:family 16 glycosylhydrolase [Bacteroidales bacterium]